MMRAGLPELVNRRTVDLTTQVHCERCKREGRGVVAAVGFFNICPATRRKVVEKRWIAFNPPPFAAYLCDGCEALAREDKANRLVWVVRRIGPAAA